MRQVGKTTLLGQQLGIPHQVTFDDEDTRLDAEASAKVFLAKLPRPVLIDEVQKVPKIFDAVKSSVDRGRRPGIFFLTGSTEFSSKVGIRESLTGRIGLIHLHPLTLGEAKTPRQERSPRFSVEDLAESMTLGGMPVPMFMRDEAGRELYWRSWLETTVYRDVRRFFGRSYDPELAMSILQQMGKVLREGELPTLAQFPWPSRKLRSYFDAMTGTFLLRRMTSHPLGVGTDAWLPADSGLAAYLMRSVTGEGVSLSLARIYILNEISANAEYSGRPVPWVYYKSSRGSPVDLIWGDVPIKIVASTGPLGWDKRALAGAMKKLEVKNALVAAPVDRADLPREGVGVVPWTYWS